MNFSEAITPRLEGERVNYLTHFAGFIIWIGLTIWLVLSAWGHPDLLAASGVYGASAMFMFFSSARYHYYKERENEQSTRRILDHMAIFVMIAGSYTPIVYIWYEDPWRVLVLALQWGLTLIGVLYKLIVAKPPRWVAPLIYVLMGWVAIGAIVPLSGIMPPEIFWSMLGGGVLYTIGAVIYAIKRPRKSGALFAFHEIFHLFILGGAAVHFVMQLLSIRAAMT